MLFDRISCKQQSVVSVCVVQSMFDGDGISAAALQDSRQPERCHSCSDKHLVKLSKEELEPVLGKVIRTVTAGQSFGELALLQRDVRRTASVIAQLLPETARGSGQQDVETVRGGSQQNDNTGARKSLQDAVAARASSQQNDKAVSLLKITRGDYDDAVSALTPGVHATLCCTCVITHAHAGLFILAPSSSVRQTHENLVIY